MSLRSNIAYLEQHVARQFALYGQVVLCRILRAHQLWKLSERKNRGERRPVDGVFPGRVQNGIERVGIHPYTLRYERSLKDGIADEVAATKRRLGAELLEHQLFDRIVKHAPTRADGHFIRTTSDGPDQALVRRRRPVDAETRCKRFVVCVRQSTRNPLVSREHQAHRRYTGGIAARLSRPIRRIEWIARVQAAWIDRGDLPGTERFHFLPNIRHRRVHFPAQPRIHLHFWTALPAIRP